MKKYLLMAVLLCGNALAAVAMGPAPAAAQINIRIPFPYIAPVEPYHYSRAYCDGCWYGDWEGRRGYHRGGGRPWEREHDERHHYGHNRYHGDNGRHEGHR